MVKKYWLPIGTCHTTCGRAVFVCSSATQDRYREKFGRRTLFGSHQCVKYWFTQGGVPQLASSHHAALWSSTSLNTASHAPAPAESRKAAVLSASAAALMLGSVLLETSMLEAHIDACMASRAFGA